MYYINIYSKDIHPRVYVKWVIPSLIKYLEYDFLLNQHWLVNTGDYFVILCEQTPAQITLFDENKVWLGSV